MPLSIVFEVLPPESPEDKSADTALRDAEEEINSNKEWAQTEMEKESDAIVLPLYTAGYSRKKEIDPGPHPSHESVLSLDTLPKNEKDFFHYRPTSLPNHVGMPEYEPGEVNYEFYRHLEPPLKYTPSRDVDISPKVKKKF